MCDDAGKLDLREIDETRRETFVPCGEKIDGRKATPPKTENNKTQKTVCQLVLVESKAPILDQAFLK